MVKRKVFFLRNNFSNNIILIFLFMMICVSLVVLGGYINNLSKNNAVPFQNANNPENLNSKAVEIKSIGENSVLSSGNVGINIVQKVK
ncbi:hypothetical protein HYX11_04070 [Candidatus Woesearchaeota archaeon]|nr:hypothetical protein [Candidatus Woesearchaeota archaeon]